MGLNRQGKKAAEVVLADAVWWSNQTSSQALPSVSRVVNMGRVVLNNSEGVRVFSHSHTLVLYTRLTLLGCAPLVSTWRSCDDKDVNSGRRAALFN